MLRAGIAEALTSMYAAIEISSRANTHGQSAAAPVGVITAMMSVSTKLSENGMKNMKRGGKIVYRRTYIWAYLDGKPLVEVIQAALDNNMMVADLKQQLIDENPGHEVTFKVVKE